MNMKTINTHGLPMPGLDKAVEIINSRQYSDVCGFWGNIRIGYDRAICEVVTNVIAPGDPAISWHERVFVTELPDSAIHDRFVDGSISPQALADLIFEYVYDLPVRYRDWELPYFREWYQWVQPEEWHRWGDANA